jgi:prephenate dehydratase
MVEMPNKPGSLHAYLQKLAKKGVNLRSISGTSSKSGRKSVVVWTAED